YAFDGLEAMQQGRQRCARLQIAAIGGQILSYQVELAHPARSKLTRLFHQVIERTAFVAPTDLWNDAEGAAVVAALRDLQVGAERIARFDPRRRGRGQQMGCARVRN